tara:strand:- start:174746 stop:175141 length:396 start_codon:yes stop_codon:yes gene_type:complete
VAREWTTRGYAAAYILRVGYTASDRDVHDVAVAANGRGIFVSTVLGCLTTTSDDASFTPLSRPAFLSGLVPGDYAIVTLLMPRYVTLHGLPLDDRLTEKHADPQCGLQIINMKTGAVARRAQRDRSLVTEL